MSAKRARDIMVPLDEYPIVDASATVLDAVIRLDEARRRSASDRAPFLAVLVTDTQGAIVGKLGQLALLRALEPRSLVVEDRDTLDKAGVSDEVMETALGHYRALQRELSELCPGAAALPVSSVMAPFTEHIDIDAAIGEVIRKMQAWRTLSLLVTDNDRPIGLVRLTDLCDEVMQQMLETATRANPKD